jgi:gluconolactonase
MRFRHQFEEVESTVRDVEGSSLTVQGAEVEWLGQGFGAFSEDGGLLGVAEGPVWIPEEESLAFTDAGKGCIHRWNERDGVTLAREDTGLANGMARDSAGRLVCCEQDRRRVTREEPDGSITVVADRYRGMRLNRPNDVVVRSDGSIWFTDPMTFGVDTELDFAGVFRVSPDLQTINCVARDFNMPNGLCFSADEQTLYVNDTNRMHIRSFTLDEWAVAGAKLDPDSGRVLHQMTPDVPGHPDGMKLDEHGNVWCTGPGGIWAISAEGEHLTTVELPVDRIPVTNFCFGGADRRTIYFTTFTELGRIDVGVAGIDPARDIAAPAGQAWTAGGRNDD